MRARIIAFIVGIIFRLFRWSWRIEEKPFPKIAQQDLDSKKTIIFAHWHGDEWPLLATFAYRAMGALVSDSKDGQIMNHLSAGLGFTNARGSSTRGGAKGFLGMIRNLKKHDLAMVSFAVDGPKGPRHEPKKGVLAMARILNAGVVVSVVSCESKWIFEKSWSEAYIPKPFAKILVDYEYVEMDSELLKDEVRAIKALKDAFKVAQLRCDQTITN